MLNIINFKLNKAVFVSEGKSRFICNILYNEKILECYVPITCKLSSLLSLEGKEILIRETTKAAKRTKFTLFAVQNEKDYLIVDTGFANHVVKSILAETRNEDLFYPEQIIENYKCDFYSKTSKTLVEVKSVITTEQVLLMPTKSGIVSWFSGLLYCADCGEKLYYSVTNNYKREQAYFFCSSFRKNSDECSTHYIREKVVMETVLESMRRIILNVQAFEKEFACKQMECYGEDKKRELAEKRRELNKAKKRIAEIDGLIQKLYEDNAIGKISDERYATLSMSYEKEQRYLKAVLPDMETYLETETDKTESLQRFIDKVKRITEIKELTSELVHEFIDKIVVHAPRYLDGKRVQVIDIYYNGVGILRELTPEEMEEAFQNHISERKAKTA